MPNIIEQHKLAFFGVPKVASSSMKRVLFELDTGQTYPDDEAVLAEGDLLHARYPSDRLRRGDFDRCERYWKFAVVRDPIDRLVSAYGHRVLGLRDLELRPSAARRARLLRVSLRPDLDEFCLRLNRYRLMSSVLRHHVAPQVEFLGHDASRLDAIYAIERTSDLTRDLSARTGQHIALPHRSGIGPRFSRNDLSVRAKRALTKNFAADYRLLRELYQP